MAYRLENKQENQSNTFTNSDSDTDIESLNDDNDEPHGRLWLIACMKDLA